MSPRLGIATVCLSGTLEDKLAAVAEAGFDGVEIFENDLVVSPWSPKQIRDRHGELLHFYTHILGGRVFFEVVQRIGGYAGYGVGNSPVRMAAHRQLRIRGAR